jgi:hypothetical protein
MSVVLTDLHMHTNKSDGTYTTYELVEKLKKKKIKLFSITDHDDIESCKEMEKINLPDDMRYIPGIELSAKHNNYNCHILGYGINYNNPTLLGECNLIKARRKKKIIQVLEYIREQFGSLLDEEEERKILNKTGTVGRADIYRFLKYKLDMTKSEIYDEYLSPKNLSDHRSNSKRIIEVIHEAGGTAVLAHPKEIEEDYNVDAETIIEELIQEGLDGIEIYNSIHTLEDVRRYYNISMKKHLQMTGGSDFHGINKPEIELGRTTKQHIKIKDSDIFFLC